MSDNTAHIHKRFADALCEVISTFLGGIICRLFIPVSHNRFGQGRVWSLQLHVCVLVCECCAAGSPFLQGQPHEAFAVLQGDAVHARCTLQRLRCSSDYDDDGVSRPVTRQQVVDGVLVHGTDT